MSKESKKALQNLLEAFNDNRFGPAFFEAFEKELRKVGLTAGKPPIAGSQRNGKRKQNTWFSGRKGPDDGMK